MTLPLVSILIPGYEPRRSERSLLCGLAALSGDLVLIPLPDHRLNEAFNNLPMLESGILRWLVICSDLLPFQTGTPAVLRWCNEVLRWIAAIDERFDREASALPAKGQAWRDRVVGQAMIGYVPANWRKAAMP